MLEALFKHRVIYVIRFRKVKIDCPVFQLYTRFTFVLLVIFSFMLAGKELTLEGKPIQCSLMPQQNVKKDLEKVINSYCWIQTTFLVPSYDSGNRTAATREAYQGLTNHKEYGGRENTKYYAYYQWVAFYLFFQAWFCYLPWYTWKHWDKGFMKHISAGLQDALQKEEDLIKKEQRLVSYLVKHLNVHSWYATVYWLAEVGCFLGILAQMLFMDWFLSGEFKKFGPNVFGLLQQSDVNPNLRTDPFIQVFPRITKCVFHKFGPANGIELYDAICILVLNNINEKIFIFLWFWFGTLAFLSVGVIVYRSLIICNSRLRRILFLSQNRMISTDTAVVIANMSASDWWIFYMLGQNLNPLLFKKVATEFAVQLEAKKEVSIEAKVV